VVIRANHGADTTRQNPKKMKNILKNTWITYQIMLALTIISLTIFFIFIFGDWTFTNDKIDSALLLFCTLTFPLGFLLVFKKRVTKIVIYIFILLLTIVVENLLINDEGRIVYFKDGIKIKENVFGWIDAFSVFYVFRQSEKYPFLEKKNPNPYGSNYCYYFDKHKVDFIDSCCVEVRYFVDGVWEEQIDTLNTWQYTTPRRLRHFK